MGRTKEPTVCFHPTDAVMDYCNCWGKDNKNAKILILGTDPTAPNKSGLLVKNIHYPFGLEPRDTDKRFLRNPYFSSIYNNLYELFGKDTDIDKFIMENVIVMNAVDKLLYDTEKKKYITTGECFRTKGNRERWIEQLKNGNALKDIQKLAKDKIVLLTSKYLLECFEDNVREEGYKLTEYPEELPKSFHKNENMWGANIVPFYRHYKYMLNKNENKKYKDYILDIF